MASDFADESALDKELNRLQDVIDQRDCPDLSVAAEKVRQEAQELANEIRAGHPNNSRAQTQAGVRGSKKKMSGEVVDSNPYSRLMALQRLGIVKDYERIGEMTVAIVGIGGVGSVAAEMLTRCGIGRLLMYDYDKVELANMNRLFFRPEQSGMTKTAAAADTLSGINPDVALESYTMNITTLQGFEQFKGTLLDADGASRVDLVLSCVDNYEARMTINEVCLELGQAWMESGVSEDAVSGHIQVLIPGETACFACVPPLVVASGIDERTLKREGVCAASLPTTMGIVAGFLVQNTLKHLLGFGQVTRYLGYSSLTDFFPTMDIKPNPGCANSLCRKQQSAFLRRYSSPEATAARAAAQREAESREQVPSHEDNEWRIEVVPEEVSPSRVEEWGTQAGLAAGLRYELPAADPDPETIPESQPDDGGEDLESLMAQLNDLAK